MTLRILLAVVLTLVFIGAGTAVIAITWPGVFNEGFVGNLITEAIGVTVFAGVVAIILKIREDRQWRPAEALMFSRVGHWIARMFMNAALLAPADGGKRPVEFGNKLARTGYVFDRDSDLDEIGQRVMNAFARLAGHEPGQPLVVTQDPPSGVGDHDNTTPKAMADELGAAIPGAIVKTVANAGHWCTLERPREIAAMAREFLR